MATVKKVEDVIEPENEVQTETPVVHLTMIPPADYMIEDKRTGETHVSSILSEVESALSDSTKTVYAPSGAIIKRG